MSYSQGNIIFHSNTSASGGGGVTGADNGLILLGNIVELGGSLIKDTSINKNAFALDFGVSDGNVSQLLLDDQNIFGMGYALVSANDVGLTISDNFSSGNTRVLINGNTSLGAPPTVIDIGLQQPFGAVALGTMQAGFDSLGNFYFRHYQGGIDNETLRIQRQSGAMSWQGSDSYVFLNKAAGAVTFDSANYINVNINGVPHKLALAT